MIDIKREVILTIPTYIPAINSLHERYIHIRYNQRERNISMLFKAKFSATSFAVKILHIAVLRQYPQIVKQILIKPFNIIMNV